MRTKRLEWERSGDCIIVTSHAPGNHGYPKKNFEGKQRLIHRVVCERRFGQLGSLRSTHSCDNRLCINPDHLRPGTDAQNVAEAAERGRLARGEGHHNSKITADDVRNMRSAKGSLRSIARRFGISLTETWRIRNRKAWKHV